VAADTGGLAFYNQNDIGRAVGAAVSDGAAYYTLGYYPPGAAADGKYLKIQVALARQGLSLRHRRGYFSLPAKPPAKNGADTPVGGELASALFDPLPATGITFGALVPSPQAAGDLRAEFWLDKASLSYARHAPGTQVELDFLVGAFSLEGKLVGSEAKRVTLRRDDPLYAEALERGLRLPVQIKLAPGEYVLRLLLVAQPAGLAGRVDVPLVVGAPPP